MPIKLRLSGYKLASTDHTRECALKIAIYNHGGEAVLDRLEKIKKNYIKKIDADIDLLKAIIEDEDLRADTESDDTESDDGKK
jgi:hypothetical protein